MTLYVNDYYRVAARCSSAAARSRTAADRKFSVVTTTLLQRDDRVCVFKALFIAPDPTQLNQLS